MGDAHDAPPAESTTSVARGRRATRIVATPRPRGAPVGGTSTQSVSNVESANTGIAGVGERRQQPGEHAGQREVERALDRERGERSLLADLARHTPRAAHQRGLGRGGGHREARSPTTPSRGRRHRRPSRTTTSGSACWSSVTRRVVGHGGRLTVRPRPWSGRSSSARPSARFMHWTAAPAVPLVRLSTAPTATIRPAASSTVTWRCTALEPRTAWVCGHCPRAAGARRARRGRPSRRPRGPRRRSTGRRRGAGGEDAAAHRHQQRGEADPDRSAVGEPRRGSARSPACAGGRRRRRTHSTLPITSLPSRCGLSALPAPEVPLARDDHDVAGVDEPGGDGGREGEGGDGRVAAGHGDPPRAEQRRAGPGSSGRP